MYYNTSQLYISELAPRSRFNDPAIDLQRPVEPESISDHDRNCSLISGKEIR